MTDETNWSSLAALRFFLAVIVAGGHLAWIDNGWFPAIFNALDPKAAVIGFLLVSGYSIAASLKRGESTFYFRRFKRIYPVYLFAVVTAIILELWLGRYQLPNYTFEPTGLIAAVGNLFFLQTFLVKPISFDGVVWSLAVEVSFYIAAPFFLRASRWVLPVLIIVSAADFILPRNFDGGLVYTYLLKLNFVKYFWPFAMGFILYHDRSNLWAIVLGLLGVLLLRIFDDAHGQLAMLTFLTSYLVLLLARNGAGYHSKFLEYLGDISYPLYLVQILVYVITFKLFSLSNSPSLLGIAIATACLVNELIDVRLKRHIFSNPSTAIIISPKEPCSKKFL